MSAHDVAIIGCGSMGIRHAKAFIAISRLDPSMRVTHVCDRDSAQAAKVADLFVQSGLSRPEVSSCVEDVLSSPDVSAVDVVLPTAMHHGVCLSALESGRNVLVEKPIAMNTAEATAMVRAAADNDVVLAVGENYRRMPANRALKSTLDEREPGDVVVMNVDIVTSQGREAAQINASWYNDPRVAGSFLAHEWGAHEVDLTRYFLGEVSTVYCVPWFPASHDSRDPREAEALFVLLSCESGAVVHLTLRQSKTEDSLGKREIVLTDRRVVSDRWDVWQGACLFNDDRARVSSADAVAAYVERARRTGITGGSPVVAFATDPSSVDRADPVRYGVADTVYDFTLAVDGAQAPEIDGLDGTRTLAVCEAIIRSAETGQAIPPVTP